MFYDMCDVELAPYWIGAQANDTCWGLGGRWCWNCLRALSL
jgi:hypothetical protein